VPGIFGVVDTMCVGPEAHQQLVALAGRMQRSMRYEASYSDILLSFPSLGACVGSVGFRVASSDRDPDVRSAVALTADGMDMSFAGAMRDAGATVACHAQEVLQAYQRSDGTDFLGPAGTYAGFIADPARRRLLLFNDPYGRERIFLHVSANRIFFSSEAKAILSVVPATRAFDANGLAELMACGCTLGARSLFREIEVLEGGTVLVVEGPEIKRRRYWGHSQLEALDHVSGQEFVQGFIESLRKAVNRLFTPGCGAVSLTGGLDSRMIMSCLDTAPGEAPCYTFGSMYRTTGDVAVARQVAAACRQPHRVIELGNEFLQNAGEHLEEAVYASDGYLGLSGAAELFCNRKGRAIAAGRMTGNWGGELMRGVRAFKYALPGGDFVSPELTAHVKESAATFTPSSSNALSAALFQQVPYQGYGRYAIERSQVRVQSPFLDPEVIRWLYRAPAATRESPATAAAVIATRPDLLSIPTDGGLLGDQPSWWRHASRRAVIKAEYLTSHGAPDWLARLSSALPPHVIETRFLGVDKFHHFRFWIRHHLPNLVRDTLAEHRDGLAAWFDMHRVNRMVTDHIDGRANHTDAIDKLLTVAIAQKRLLASPTSTRRVKLDRPELVF
jgi:asparagine synthase (glutamine-hydrolysing)